MANYGSIFGGSRDYGQQYPTSGDDSGIGSGIAGAAGAGIGSLLGPVGTALGGLLGSGLSKLFSDNGSSAAAAEAQRRKKEEHDKLIHDMATQKLNFQPSTMAAPQVQSAPAAPQVAQQSSIPGLEDPEYYQKLAQQKYRSAMGA